MAAIQPVEAVSKYAREATVKQEQTSQSDTLVFPPPENRITKRANMSSESLKDLLRGGGRLKALADRAERMVSLADRIRDALPEPERHHVSGVSVAADGQLNVTADSAAWAARVRYRADDLLVAARRHGIAATRCRVRVAPQG